jgi:hypothetical protein
MPANRAKVVRVLIHAIQGERGFLASVVSSLVGRLDDAFLPER